MRRIVFFIILFFVSSLSFAQDIKKDTFEFQASIEQLTDDTWLHGNYKDLNPYGNYVIIKDSIVVISLDCYGATLTSSSISGTQRVPKEMAYHDTTEPNVQYQYGGTGDVSRIKEIIVKNKKDKTIYTLNCEKLWINGKHRIILERWENGKVRISGHWGTLVGRTTQYASNSEQYKDYLRVMALYEDKINSRK